LTKENQADKAAERHHQKYEGGAEECLFINGSINNPARFFSAWRYCG
jgi:hypothetical protein